MEIGPLAALAAAALLAIVLLSISLPLVRFVAVGFAVAKTLPAALRSSRAQPAASALAAGLAALVQTVLQRTPRAKRCTMSMLAPDI